VFAAERGARPFVPSGEAGPLYSYNQALNDVACRVLTVCSVKRSELIPVDFSAGIAPVVHVHNCVHEAVQNL